MIKVFNGGYEVAEEYYFTYEDNGTQVYDNDTRIISGLLHVRNLTEQQQLDFVTNVDDANLVILEPAQTGYMVNLLNVRDIEFTTKMSNTDSIYRITGAKKMKPRRAKGYKLKKMTDEYAMAGFTVDILVSVTVDHVTSAGNIRMADGQDIRYLWVSDDVLPDLQFEIGKCRIKTGSNFYVTQTGGSDYKMQMPSKSGIPFPNGKVTFSSIEPTMALFAGQRLEVN